MTGPLGKTEQEAIFLWNEQGESIRYYATEIVIEALKSFTGRVNDEALREEIMTAIKERLTC